MDDRYRWFTISPLGRKQVAGLAAAMQARLYGRNVKSGFALSTVRTELIEGTYTERLEFLEKINDPLGGEVSVSRVDFRRTDFRITTTLPQLELRSPQRNYRSLLNQIANALDFQVAITPAEVSPLKWAAALSNQEAKVEIVGLKSARFSLSNEAQAFVNIIGTADITKLLPLLIGKRSVDADALVCQWTTDEGKWRVVLKVGGCAQILSSPSDRPSAAVRTALAVSLKPEQ